jgi:DNA-binding MarR family transcriptional regulator
MEKEGFVKRVQDEYDMRATRVFLTKKGLEISNSHKNLLSKTDEAIMKDIPERDERVAMYVLEKMLDNLVEN